MIKRFKSFEELENTPLDESEYEEAKSLINKIYDTKFQNIVWVGSILDYLNSEEEVTYYEFYMEPSLFGSARKHMYHIIARDENSFSSLTDSDMEVLKRLNAIPPFIVYEYNSSQTDAFAYLDEEKSLREVLESVGMTDDIKRHLCEFCFYRVKEIQEVSNKQYSLLPTDSE